MRDPALRDVTFRPATEADLEGEHAVFVAAEGELLARHRFAWSPPSLERVAPGRRHVRRTDPDRCVVADVDGVVVGYAGAIVRGDTWFLSSLFIDPAHQGRGIGRRLFELAFADAPPRRLTISDAIQPVSNALYGSYGLLPTTPIVTFEGTATIAAPPVDLVASDPTPAALALLDASAYGFDRAVDHAFWATQSAGTVWLRAGEPLAYSYRWPSGRIGPIAGRDGAAAADALRAELARAGGGFAEIPGTSRALVAAALGAGLRIVAPPGLLLTSDGVAPPRALAISSYGLL